MSDETIEERVARLESALAQLAADTYAPAADGAKEALRAGKPELAQLLTMFAGGELDPESSDDDVRD